MTTGKHTPQLTSDRLEQIQDAAQSLMAGKRDVALALKPDEIYDLVAGYRQRNALYEALESLAYEITIAATAEGAKKIIEDPMSHIGGALAQARAVLSLARGEKP